MKKIFIFALSLVLAFSMVSPSFASGLTVEKKSTQPTDGYLLELDERTENFLKIYTTSGIMTEITTDNTGNMILLNSDVNYLMEKYNLDIEFIELLNAIIDDANAKGLTKGLANADRASISPPEDTIITPMVYVEDWKVYFSNDEVKMYFFAAASIGPAALAAALNSVVFMLGGPVATTISLVLSIIGAASLLNLTYLVIQAGTQGKGIYIGVTWNGVFPNYTQGTW